MNALMDIWTVFWRDWVVLRRRLTKFILSRMVAPMLYLVAFGWGLGRSIQVASGTYLDFLVPGILALNSMNISFNSITPVHAERIYHKSLEEYLIAPIWPPAFVIGKVLAAVLRGPSPRPSSSHLRCSSARRSRSRRSFSPCSCSTASSSRRSGSSRR